MYVCVYLLTYVWICVRVLPCVCRVYVGGLCLQTKSSLAPVLSCVLSSCISLCRLWVLYMFCDVIIALKGVIWKYESLSPLSLSSSFPSFRSFFHHQVFITTIIIIDSFLCLYSFPIIITFPSPSPHSFLALFPYSYHYLPIIFYPLYLPRSPTFLPRLGIFYMTRFFYQFLKVTEGRLFVHWLRSVFLFGFEQRFFRYVSQNSNCREGCGSFLDLFLIIMVFFVK